MDSGNAALFELEVQLPDKRLESIAKRLIGFDSRYDRIRQDLRLLIDSDGLEQWSQKHYKTKIPLLAALSDRYPLVIFHGDVGTGKTATAEAIANRLSSELGKEARLFKLSTRVRGEGSVGEMSALINKAFEVTTKEAGKTKLSFLIIDEADSLASSRTQVQSHHEDKVAVNTLIQKIDDIRRFNGRFLVFLCTNHLHFLDSAILRRASYVEEFNRPDEKERLALLNLDCEGLGLKDSEVHKLATLMGPNGQHILGYTFSDIRTRVLPDALARAYPDRGITAEDLFAAIETTKPTKEVN